MWRGAMLLGAAVATWSATSVPAQPVISYRFRGVPVLAFWRDPVTRGLDFEIGFRLNLALPHKPGHGYQAVAVVNGAGGLQILSWRNPKRHCYIQPLEERPRGLAHPRIGQRARMVLYANGQAVLRGNARLERAPPFNDGTPLFDRAFGCRGTHP